MLTLQQPERSATSFCLSRARHRPLCGGRDRDSIVCWIAKKDPAAWLGALVSDTAQPRNPPSSAPFETLLPDGAYLANSGRGEFAN